MYEVARFGPVVRIRLCRSLLGRPTLWVHAFWVDGLLIDTGCTHTIPDLMTALQREGLTVEQLVNTHSHEDHLSGNGAVHRRYGVTPKAHPLALPQLAAPVTWSEMHLYRQLFWGLVRDPVPGEPVGEVVQTDRYRFAVHHTPGHAHDHIALFEEREGWLFSGDLMISPRLTAIRRHERPLLLLESLRRLAALPVRQLFCSHAYRVADSAAPLLQKIAFWEELQGQAAELRRQGLSLSAITRRLLPGGGLIEPFSRGDYARSHLIRGLLGEGGS